MGNPGVDYGLGRTNVDPQTGIRYGVISQNSVLQAWSDRAEPDYGKPTCPKCGNYAQETADILLPMSEDDGWELDGNEFACEGCKYSFDSDDAFGDEPLGWSYEGEGYKLCNCLDTDIFIVESPYYSFAQFCSPCVPGAGNLNHPMPGGIKCYCLGHDWFENGKATYPVYSVVTDEEVQP